MILLAFLTPLPALLKSKTCLCWHYIPLFILKLFCYITCLILFSINLFTYITSSVCVVQYFTGTCSKSYNTLCISSGASGSDDETAQLYTHLSKCHRYRNWNPRSPISSCILVTSVTGHKLEIFKSLPFKSSTVTQEMQCISAHNKCNDYLDYR